MVKRGLSGSIWILEKSVSFVDTGRILSGHRKNIFPTNQRLPVASCKRISNKPIVVSLNQTLQQTKGFTFASWKDTPLTA